ncbi:CDP-alcohol phosphatidyltransferase [Paracoccus liaowanqingii]|uniref:CDP-alcohol phosphatidyltransferase n=2 Tax=Paracoccus liaowanqingii TaxID=2560053 RepID=A0A4Z1C168_9RHOB|nr:CDP-alcohol phosphatidyltransferase [Paracoccus liaowanqingii]
MFRSYCLAMQISPPRTASIPPAATRRHLPEGLALALPAGLALTLAVGVLVLNQGSGALLAGGAYLAAAALVGVMMLRYYPHDRLGACNAVTLMRMALTIALLAPLVGVGAAGWIVAGIATLSLTLDGVDGYLARRSGLCSAFGARFDMEVDAGLALILALHAYVGSPVGAEVLILGIMRYVFVALGWIFPWMTAPLPVSYVRKTVCVLQLATLIALQLPQMPPDLAIWLTRLVSAALLWSFGSDMLWLRRTR